MRATYEDLLRTARRIAVSAQRGKYPDERQLMTDWQAVLAATRYHLRWLRGGLRTGSNGEPAPGPRSDNALGRLAQAIGAAADVLAVQDTTASVAFEVRDDLVAARAEVAGIALMAGRAVAGNRPMWGAGSFHLRRVMSELGEIADADIRRTGLGGLAGLAAGGPALLGGEWSMVASAAVRWERAHASIPPQTVLTRDLRSTTAQLRAVGGFLGYMVSDLLSSPSAGLDAGERQTLLSVRHELQGFAVSARGVERAWRRRLSDLSGLSDSPGEEGFLDLRSSFLHVLRDGQGLRGASDLVPDRRAADRVFDVVDEVLWTTAQVAEHLQGTATWLIEAGRLFVPRSEAVLVDLSYLRRPSGGSRPLQAKWVRTDLEGCFEELTTDLAGAAEHLRVASAVFRRFAGTAGMSRRVAEPVTRLPQPCTNDSRMEDPGQEIAGLVR
jgi:hypothetical protein